MEHPVSKPKFTTNKTYIRVFTFILIALYLLQVNLSNDVMILQHRTILTLLGATFILFYLGFIILFSSVRLKRSIYMLPLLTIIAFVLIAEYLTQSISSPINYLLLIPIIYSGFLLPPSKVVSILILELFGSLSLFSVLGITQLQVDYFTPIITIGILSTFIAYTNSKREAYFLEAMKIAGNLEGINRIKDEFTSLISHHLNTPLTVIKGNLSLLDAPSNKLSEQERKPINIITIEVQKLNNLINTLTTISNLKTGQAKFEQKDHTFEEIIAATMKYVQNSLEEKPIKLDVNYHGFEQSAVSVDDDFFSLALSNIVDNAIKFSSKGSTVTLETNFKNDRAEFVVRDDGLGIAKNELNRIFEIFHRGEDNYLSYDSDGTGIGLNFANTIISMHKGKIDIKSEENVGTTVTVSIPVTEVSSFLER